MMVVNLDTPAEMAELLYGRILVYLQRTHLHAGDGSRDICRGDRQREADFIAADIGD